MHVDEVKRVIERNKKRMAFLVGNGINKYFKTSFSWSDLLLELWEKFSFNTQSIIPKGISFTEFYDLMEIQNYQRESFTNIIQKEVKDLYKKILPNEKQNILLQKIQSLNVPILTTNFDDLIPKSLDLDFFNPSQKEFTDYYPWECYYSNEKIDIPTDKFGVWYPNGMIRYHRSIKLGLSQYMGNVDRARRMIHGNSENIAFDKKNKNEWPGLKTWLHILFNKALFVFGLGLEETEVFLRWLLIERAKYFRKYPNRKFNGWYLKPQSEKNKGKDFFLTNIGFEVIELSDYKEIYEELWK